MSKRATTTVFILAFTFILVVSWAPFSNCEQEAEVSYSELEAELEHMMITLDDLPSGFTIDSKVFRTNEEAAQNSDDPEESLERFTEWDRLLSYEVSFSREVTFARIMEGGMLELSVTLIRYEDKEGAKEHLEFMRDRISEVPSQFVGEEVSDVEMSSISFPELGEESLAERITGTANFPDMDMELDVFSDFIALRQGRVSASIFTVAFSSPAPIEKKVSIACSVETRLKDTSS